MDDGHEVLSQLLWSVSSAMASACVAPVLLVNDQLNATCVEKKLEKVEPESGESVAVCDNNLLDEALDASDDQTLNTGALETHTGADVLDNSVSGIFFSKVTNLAIQIALLLVRRYSTI